MINKLKASLFALCTLLVFISGSVQAELAAIPALKTRVTDLTQTLTAEQQNQLESKLANFEQQKGSQIAVLIVPTTQPEDIAQYSIRVAESWKLGREKQDDGILVLVAKDDRKMRIEVGYGLEGAIPDLIAKRIISEVMAPKFKQGDFYGGIDAAVDKLIGLTNGENLPAPKAKPHKSSNFDNIFPLLLFGGLISGLFLRSILGNFMGSAVNGGLLGTALWMLGFAIGGALLLGLLAFFFTMMMGTRNMNGFGSYPTMGGGLGGFGGGGFGGGNDSFSGGGGDFGGGGASGDW
ncbi:MAG TPA: YgcG family protein [Methylotenera sp.]|nr:YgcG family protein [Methylotenera sp.]